MGTERMAMSKPKSSALSVQKKKATKSPFSRRSFSESDNESTSDDFFPVSGSGMELDWGSIPVNPPESTPQVQGKEESEKKDIQAKEDASSPEDEEKIQANASTNLESGKHWVSKFPTSTSIDDLKDPFKTNVSNFVNALENAGVNIHISATLRPSERAYLMHHAYKIAKGSEKPSEVPSHEGVDIIWLHTNSQGEPDMKKSIKAAQDMVSAYNIAYPPSLTSNHIKGLAIDMTISWTGELDILDANGKKIKITSKPNNGNNSDLHRVGTTYSVKKLVTDPPHWSYNGR